MADQEVRQVERTRLGVAEVGEHGRRREELVAVRARQPVDPFLGDRIEPPADRSRRRRRRCALPARCNRCARLRDALRTVVQLRRQALHVHGGPAVEPLERNDFACDRSTGDDQQRLGTHRLRPQCRAARRVAISDFAVSTATAASRQYASAPIAFANSSLSGAPPTSTMYLLRRPCCWSVSMTTFM